MSQTNTPGRIRISSGTPWEELVGYSRATVVGNSVFVSGTTAIRQGKLVGLNDPAAQTRQILQNMSTALQEAGSGLDDIVRYRIYLTRIDDWSEIATVLSETFAEIRPCNTLVAVAALVDPDMLVEIEADAIIGSASRVTNS